MLDSMQPAAIPPEMRVPARGLLPVNISIPVKPSARARGDAGGCPFVQGDMPHQKRLFDVIAAGCLPVLCAFRQHRRGGSSALRLFSAN